MADTDVHIGNIVAYIPGTGGSGCGNLDDDLTSNIRYVKILEIDGDSIVRYKALDQAFRQAVGKKSGVNWPEVTNCCTLTLSHFQKVKSANTLSMVQKITNIARKLLDADTRDLIKAGFMDECLNITEEGEDAIFANWLLTAANKKSLAEDARAKIAEDEGEEDEDE